MKSALMRSWSARLAKRGIGLWVRWRCAWCGPAGGRSLSCRKTSQHGGREFGNSPADRLVKRGICERVVWRRIPVHDDQPRAGLDGEAAQRRGRLDGERAADRQEQVTSLSDGNCAGEDIRI